jgi:HEAT repeat protein
MAQMPVLHACCTHEMAISLHQRSINLLGQALRDDADPEVRKAAISALQRVGCERARRALERAARDPDPSISQAAEQALQDWPESPD